MGSSIFSETLATTYQKTTHSNNPQARSMDSIFLLLVAASQLSVMAATYL